MRPSFFSVSVTLVARGTAWSRHGHFWLLVCGHGEKEIKRLSFLSAMDNVLGKAG